LQPQTGLTVASQVLGLGAQVPAAVAEQVPVVRSQNCWLPQSPLLVQATASQVPSLSFETPAACRSQSLL
jgi:hypothetical protein